MAKKTPQARKAIAGKAKAGSGGTKSAVKSLAKVPPKKTAPKPLGKSAPKPVAKVPVKTAPKAAVKSVPSKPLEKGGTSAKSVGNPAGKPVGKPVTKPVSVPAASKVVAGKAPAAVKVAEVSKVAASVKPTPGAKPAVAAGKVATVKAVVAKGAPTANTIDDAKKGGRKGITVVDAKPALKKASKPKEKPASVAPPSVGRLLDPKNPIRRPLIPSGPKAAHIRPLGMQGPEEDRPVVSGKTPFGKKELAHFRQVLIRKRAELVGDVSQMESEALQGNSGTTSVPQHMAEQGSDTYDQSLALDIAAADRKLIKEIDDAIKRIDTGTFGICELTGKAIKTERLEELPWARYSIEAARELERRSMWA